MKKRTWVLSGQLLTFSDEIAARPTNCWCMYHKRNFQALGRGKLYQLIPLHFFALLGMGWAAVYTARLATKNPDCCINRGANPYPWQKLGVNGQYKFWSETIDYKALKAPAERPDID